MRRKIRGLHILWTGVKGGAEKNATQIAIGLNGNDFIMDILFLNNEGYWGKIAESHGVRVFSLNLKTARSIKSVLSLYKFLNSTDYDFYHDHISPPYTKILLKMLGKKVIFTLHGPPYLVSGMSFFRRFLIVNFADWYVAPSKFMQEYYKNEFKKDAVLIYHGVEIPPPIERRIEKKKVLIGTLTHLEKVKGNDILIEAVNLLYKMGYRDFKTIIVGHGSQYKELMYMIKKYGLVDYISIVDSVKIQEFLKEIDIYVSTSRDESFGIALIEAMSYCLPIVCTNIGSFSEIVVSGENGYLCSRPVEIAENLAKLIDSPDLRIKLGTKGYEIVCEKFDIKQMLNKYKDFYLNVIRK